MLKRADGGILAALLRRRDRTHARQMAARMRQTMMATTIVTGIEI